MKPRLAEPSFKPQKSHIHAAVENFSDLLRIRYSSPLFRLRTANAIQVRGILHSLIFPYSMYPIWPAGQLLVELCMIWIGINFRLSPVIEYLQLVI